MKNIGRGKVPILAFLVIVFLVGFFVLMFMLYDVTVYLYAEIETLIETIRRRQ